MPKDANPPIPDLTFVSAEIKIDIERLYRFFNSSGSTDNWGTHASPFPTDQFYSLDSKQKDDNDVLLLKPNQSWQFTVKSREPSEGLTLECQFIQFYYLGGVDYSEQTPQDQWSTIFDLAQSDGAISENGHFHLGKTRSAIGPAGTGDVFFFVTACGIEDISPNLAFNIRFCLIIKDPNNEDNFNRRFYGRIDPLVRTSGDREVQ